MLMLAVVAALAVGLAAETRAADRAGEGRVKFEKLIEKKVGETEYLGIVVHPLEGGGSATLLLGRKHRLAAAVRKLKKGLVIAVRYGAEGGHDWLTRMEVVGEGEGERRREGDRERKREGDRERKREGDHDRKREGERARGREGGDRDVLVMLRRLAERLERLEKQVRELRAENAQLRKRLGMKGEGDRERKREGDRERKRDGDRERKRDGDREKAGPKDDDREG